MQKVFKLSLFALVVLLFAQPAFAQETSGSDTTITSIEADLINLFSQKTAKKYKVAAIKVSGNRFFDENLLISIANISIGDEIAIPGGDQFSKAITKLWAQNYFSDVEIYVTRVAGKEIDLEIVVTERPRLSNFYFKGIPKGQSDDLRGKTGLVPNRVITENMKITATEVIKKFFAEKGYRETSVKVAERKDSSSNNTLALDFTIDKGSKIKISNINFGSNTVDEAKLKKQLKGSKEKSRLTLYPTFDSGKIVVPDHYTFDEYMKEKGYLTFSKTKKVLNPYVRIKLASAKFDEVFPF